MEKPFGATDALVASFRSSRDHATIEANHRLLQEATDEATKAADQASAALAVVSSLIKVNRLLCDHQGSSTYTDPEGVVHVNCPHCGDHKR